MRLDLEKIFNQAVQDHGSANLDSKGYQSRMMHGVQIVRDDKTKKIQIFNPGGKNYYEELTDEQYDLFQKGWRRGVYDLVLEQYKKRLKVLEKKIAEEVSKKKANASISGFTKQRLSIMNKYFKITQKKNEQK